MSKPMSSRKKIGFFLYLPAVLGLTAFGIIFIRADLREVVSHD